MPKSMTTLSLSEDGRAQGRARVGALVLLHLKGAVQTHLLSRRGGASPRRAHRRSPSFDVERKERLKIVPKVHII